MAQELRKCGCGETTQKEPINDCMECSCGKKIHSKFSIEQHKRHKKVKTIEHVRDKRRYGYDRKDKDVTTNIVGNIKIVKMPKYDNKISKELTIVVDKNSPIIEDSVIKKKKTYCGKKKISDKEIEQIKICGITMDKDGRIPNMNDDLLKQLASDLRKGLICSSGHVPDDLLLMVFTPLAIISDDDIRGLVKADIGLIYEYNDRAVEKADKYPIFNSMRVLNRDDTFKLGVFYKNAWKGAN